MPRRPVTTHDNAILPYFYSSTAAAASLLYRGKPSVGDWYVMVRRGQTAILHIPNETLEGPGTRYLNWLKEGEKQFTDDFLRMGRDLRKMGDAMQERLKKDRATGAISDISEWYPEYRVLTGTEIGIGYSLERVFDLHFQKQGIQVSELPINFLSFSMEESLALQKLFETVPAAERDQVLKEHAEHYSWILNDWMGTEEVTVQYLKRRHLPLQRMNQTFTDYLAKKPATLEGWAGAVAQMRDLRIKCEQIAASLADRYLRQECEKYRCRYEEAVMYTVEEFDALKADGLPKTDPVRLMHIHPDGVTTMTQDEWNQIAGTSDQQLVGRCANPGKVVGKARIVLSRYDFHKVQDGDILVTAMIRPEFAQTLSRCAGLITNEVGITSDAPLLSRGLGLPCVIDTVSATRMFRDGDLLDLDADNGIVTLLKKG